MNGDLRKFNLLAIVCFLLLVASSSLFYLREQIYVRPESYFYLLSLALAITFAQVLFFRENFVWIGFVFFTEVLLIALSFVLTQQALYKTVLGRDPWFHWILTEEIVRRGYIPPYNDIPMPYVKMPNFHLLIASGIILADLQYKWAQFLSAGLPTLILLMLVAYLYSKKLFGHQVGLASLLLVAISDNVLDMVGKSVIPNSVGVALTFLIFYLVYFGNINNNKIKLLAIILATSLVLMHTVSFSFLIWQVFVISTLSLIFRENTAKGYLSVLGLLIVLAIFEWALYSGFYLENLITIFKQLFIYGFDTESYEARLPTTFLDALIARLGMFLYFAIAGVALLWTFVRLFKQRFRDRLMLSNIVATGGIVAGVGSFITPALNGISHRFWYYGEVLSSAFVGWLLVDNRAKNRKITFVFAVILIFLLSFLMMKANVANDDNPLVPYYSQRTGWYDSEITAGKFIISAESEIPLASDFDYSWNLKYLKTYLYSSGKLEEVNRAVPKTFEEVESCGCIFIFRKEGFENRLFYLSGRWTQTPHLPLKDSTPLIDELSEQGSVIYGNNNVLMILEGSK